MGVPSGTEVVVVVAAAVVVVDGLQSPARAKPAWLESKKRARDFTEKRMVKTSERSRRVNERGGLQCQDWGTDLCFIDRQQRGL